LCKSRVTTMMFDRTVISKTTLPISLKFQIILGDGYWQNTERSSNPFPSSVTHIQSTAGECQSRSDKFTNRLEVYPGENSPVNWQLRRKARQFRLTFHLFGTTIPFVFNQTMVCQNDLNNNTIIRTICSAMLPFIVVEIKFDELEKS